MTLSKATRDRMIRTLLVDDEPLARRGLELRLADERDIHIVGQVGDGAAAVRAVSEHAPDLLFLDVQMPGLDGFATLRAIPAQQMPLVVFVTAYDHYALNAFEASAVDYLLKPVDEGRLHQALFRVREALDRREASDHRAKLLGLLGALEWPPGADPGRGAGCRRCAGTARSGSAVGHPRRNTHVAPCARRHPLGRCGGRLPLHPYRS